MNQSIFKRLIIEVVVLLICSIVLLFQLNWLSFPSRQSQADVISTPVAAPAPADYSLGMIAPNLNNQTEDQLYDDINLSFVRLSGLYPLPIDKNKPVPNPDKSFPK